MNAPVIRAALLGTGIGHSLSPVIHREAAACAGLTLEYELWETTPATLAGQLDRARQQGLAGLNLTAPLKQAVLPLLQSLEDTARLCGSVNTLVPEGSGWRGLSTDGEGFLAPLVARGLSPATVRLLGAGGAARAVAHALRGRWPAVELELCSRDTTAARALAAGLPGPPVGVLPFDAPLPARLDLLVNATPLGMAGRPSGPLPCTDPDPGRVHCVYDLVSVPARTPLLAAAARAGCITVPGLEMLVAQAARAFATWTGAPFPADHITRLCRMRLLPAGPPPRPIVLTGLPGSGKSTLAPLLAAALGLAWADLDNELARRSGRSVEHWFSREGEEAFRHQERNVFRELLQPGGPAILAAGGGLTVQPGFLGEFAERAYFVFLDGEPGLLAGRVLSAGAAGARPLLGPDPARLAGRLAELAATRRAAYGQADRCLELIPGETPHTTLVRLLATLEPYVLESVC